MAELTKEEMRERLGNIDQIRDIIFGAQLREYNTRFDKLDSDVARVQQDLQERIDQVKVVLSNELRAAVEAIDKKVKSMTLTAQEDRQQIDRLNQKFSASVEAVDEALDQQTTSLRNELAQTRDKLADDIRSLKSVVFEELDTRFGLLRNVKVSKDDMAEILFEVGMRLKGTEFVPEIKEAARTQNLQELLLPDSHQ